MTRGNAESVYLDEAFDASVGTIITSSYATIPGIDADLGRLGAQRADAAIP
jgi:hypothetical protein